MHLFNNWSTTNWISFISLLISIVTATLLVKNFLLGQRQTKTSLAINQFNICNAELKDFISEAKEIKFKTSLTDLNIDPSFSRELQNSDGILYITLFLFDIYIKATLPSDTERKKEIYVSRINDIRTNIIFPLEKYYDKLLHYLEMVKNDTILLEQYKKIIFMKAERDILQTYFRICNNRISFTGELNYDLSQFKTPAYDSKTFYRINQFYIDNNLFQFKSLEFYIDIS